MIALLLSLACSPPPPPTLVIEAAWPGHGPDEVDATLATAVSSALQGAPVVRCESVVEGLRCLVEGRPPAAVQQQLQQLDLSWPEGATSPQVYPLLTPGDRWLVLDDAPEAWVWVPDVVVHARWPVPRLAADGRVLGDHRLDPGQQVQCDGRPATALWVSQLPQVPPPAGLSVRTWRAEGAVHLQGRHDQADAVRAALDGLPHCLSVGPEHLAAVVQAEPARLAEVLPEVDVVPPTARSRRYTRDDDTGLDELRALPGVWAVRVVGHQTGTVVEWAVNPDRLEEHGIDLGAFRAAVQPEPVQVGGLTLASQVPERIGDVPIEALGSRVERPEPAVWVRVNGQRTHLVEVLVADEAAAARVDARAPGEPLEPWAVRPHRP